jgi:hypothetical protein
MHAEPYDRRPERLDGAKASNHAESAICTVVAFHTGRSAAEECELWLESSTNNGKTWEQATPTYSLNILSGLEYAFSPAVADGTGHLVRACVQGNAAKKCSAAW